MRTRFYIEARGFEKISVIIISTTPEIYSVWQYMQEDQVHYLLTSHKESSSYPKAGLTKIWGMQLRIEFVTWERPAFM